MSEITASFTVAMDGETATVTDTSTAAPGTTIDAVSFTWSDGPATECTPGGSVSHTYPNGSQRKIVQTVTGATTVVATSEQVCYPKYTKPPVLPPPPPISPPPPTPPATSSDGSPPPAHGITAQDGTVIPYPLTDSGAGTAAIAATLADGTVWTASASVSGHCKDAPQHLRLNNAAGAAHPDLTAQFFGDGVVLWNALTTASTAYVLSFAVTFNGKTIYQSAQKTLYARQGFWPIRWSQCGWQPVNLAQCPHWGTDLPDIRDWTKFQLGIDLRGPATYNQQGSPGERADLGIAPDWDVSFALRPCDNAWIVARLAADSAVVWPYHVFDPATLEPLYLPDYPNATLLNFGTQFAPIASPQGGCPYVPSPEHQTHYGPMAYMASGSAFDAQEVVHNANYGILCQNPYYRGATGEQGFSLIYSDIRQKAWAIAGYMWAAALLPTTSKYQAYFRKVVSDNAAAFSMAYLGDTSVFPNGITYPTKAHVAPGQFTNPMNVFADGGAYGETPSNGGASYPGWQDDYFLGVADWGTEQLGFAEWKPVRDWKAGFTMHLFNDACGLFASSYLQCVAPVSSGPGKAPASWFANYADGFNQAWPWAAGLACGSAAQLAAIRAHPAGLQGLPPQPGDMVGGPASASGYPAIKRQAVAAAVNAGLTGAQAAWTLVTTTPTKITWGGAKYNIVPR
jgi:hypothetical protein